RRVPLPPERISPFKSNLRRKRRLRLGRRAAARQVEERANVLERQGEADLAVLHAQVAGRALELPQLDAQAVALRGVVGDQRLALQELLLEVVVDLRLQAQSPGRDAVAAAETDLVRQRGLELRLVVGEPGGGHVVAGAEAVVAGQRGRG